MSLWRLQQILADWLRQAVKGVITLAALRDNWTDLHRHLCDSPRQRRRRTLDHLPVLTTFLDT